MSSVGKLRLALVLLPLGALLAGCVSDRHLEILGYTTEPPYDAGIRTVYVPIFENVSFRRGLEFDLHRAVVREIEAKTPYKTVNCREQADTELRGKILNRNKSLLLHNQLGEIREGEAQIAVELLWLDMRPGHMGEPLAQPDGAREVFGRRGQRFLPGAPLTAEEQTRQGPMLDKSGKPLPVLIQPTATFIPELGGSITSAEKQLVDRLAIQIVSMMEQPW
jgi:hypothetical protein